MCYKMIGYRRDKVRWMKLSPWVNSIWSYISVHEELKYGKARKEENPTDNRLEFRSKSKNIGLARGSLYLEPKSGSSRTF